MWEMHLGDNKTIKMHNGGKIMFTWMLLMEQWWKVQKMVMIALFYIKRCFFIPYNKAISYLNLWWRNHQGREIMKKSCKNRLFQLLWQNNRETGLLKLLTNVSKKVVLKQNKIGTFSLKISHSTMRNWKYKI